MGAIIRLSSFFPDIGMKCSCEKALIILNARPGRYMGMSLALSALVASAVFLASVFSVPMTLLAFAFTYALMLAIPNIEMRSRAQEIEAAMPFFLRALGMLLEMGLPWRRAIEAACPQEGALREEMFIAIKTMDEGSGFHRALSHLATYDSLAIKRAVSQMVCAYDTGASGKEMMRIGDELLSMEQHRLKEFSAKSSMFGLLFVVFCAIAPTFYLIYAVAGPLAFDSGGVDKGQMAWMMLVIFPLISILILMLSKSAMPRSALGRRMGMDIRMLAPGALLVIGFLLFPNYPLPIMVAGIAVGAFIAYGSFDRERRLEQVDASLPDALLSVSGMPGASGADRIFRLIEEGGFGALSNEAGKTRRQLAMNVRVEAALRDFAARNPTALISRASMMMGQMIKTGSLSRLGALAEDMIRGAQTERERSQLFSMQKYTLIFGALLIPLVFRMALGLSETIGELSGAPETGVATIIPPYLAIYAVTASLAISDAQGSRSALALYSVGLLGISLAAFHFISF
ncbi:MAG: type II secretion system F family protein [Candidatus Micrarchaeota archaeon]